MKRTLSAAFVLSLCGSIAGCNHAPAAEAGEPAAHASDSVKIDPNKLKFIKTEVLQESDGGYTERYLRAHVPGAPNTIVRARVERIEHGEIYGTPA